MYPLPLNSETATHLPYPNFSVSVKERVSSSLMNLMERGMGENKKRVFPDQHDQEEPKRTCHSFPSGFEALPVIIAELFSDESLSQIEDLLRKVVSKEVESKLESHFSSRSSKPNDLTGEEAVAGPETMNLKLRILSQIPSTIFTNSKIPLHVALCDATNLNNIVQTSPFSTAAIEILVLDGDSDTRRRPEETCWTMSDFSKSVLQPRDGKGPLIVGNVNVCLRNGVVSVDNLSFTDNSSWRSTKKFRLGVRILDREILAKYPRIGEAVSQPFRVMDQRGEVNKKHHPPNREDEVWRLEGIGKDGVYHSRLSAEAINTVADFLKTYYEKGALYLRKLLGKKVLNKTWKAMLDNALECQDFVGQEAMGGHEEALNKNSKVDEQKKLGDGYGFPETFDGDYQNYDFMFESTAMDQSLPFGCPSLFPHGDASTSNSYNHEVENTGTGNKYYHGAWSELVPKPK